MNPSGLTSWGEKLLYVRGLCVGLLLSAPIAPPPNPKLMLAAGLGMAFSTFITPVLRALGWRRLVERAEDAPTGPLPNEVERALRAALKNGMDVHEAVRFLRSSEGWDVLHLAPAVTAVTGLQEKEAIRLVMSVVFPSPSAPPNHPVQQPS